MTQEERSQRQLLRGLMNIRRTAKWKNFCVCKMNTA